MVYTKIESAIGCDLFQCYFIGVFHSSIFMVSLRMQVKTVSNNLVHLCRLTGRSCYSVVADIALILVSSRWSSQFSFLWSS